MIKKEIQEIVDLLITKDFKIISKNELNDELYKFFIRLIKYLNTEGKTISKNSFAYGEAKWLLQNLHHFKKEK